jgi:hypothetical protein
MSLMTEDSTIRHLGTRRADTLSSMRDEAGGAEALTSVSTEPDAVQSLAPSLP